MSECCLTPSEQIPNKFYLDEMISAYLDFYSGSSGFSGMIFIRYVHSLKLETQIISKSLGAMKPKCLPGLLK